MGNVRRKAHRRHEPSARRSGPAGAAYRRVPTPRSPSRRVATPALLAALLGVLLLGAGLRLAAGGQPTVTSGVPEEGVAADGADVQTQSEAEVSISMVGDVLQHYGVYTSGERQDGTRNFDHVFAHVKGYLADDDIRVVNQETPIAGE